MWISYRENIPWDQVIIFLCLIVSWTHQILHLFNLILHKRHENHAGKCRIKQIQQFNSVTALLNILPVVAVRRGRTGQQLRKKFQSSYFYRICYNRSFGCCFLGIFACPYQSTYIIFFPAITWLSQFVNLWRSKSHVNIHLNGFCFLFLGTIPSLYECLISHFCHFYTVHESWLTKQLFLSIPHRLFCKRMTW